MSALVGVVDDSLHGGPLAGAVVLLDGQPREAVTDSVGRFRIDSVAAGKYRVGIFHPMFDSLGTGVTSTPVKLSPGKPAVLTLATPLGRAIRQALCRDVSTATTQSDNADSTAAAVLVGHVLDSDTDEPIEGAHVTLTWTDIVISPMDLRNTVEVREATSDRDGEFRFCALPAGVAGILRVTRNTTDDSATAAERELDLGPRIVTMTTLHLASARVDTSTAPATVSASAESAASPAAESPTPVPAPTVATPTARPVALPRLAVLTGHVQRPDGSPLSGAIASVVGTPDSAVAGNDGSFTIRHLPSGTHTLYVRYVGFEPVEVPVELTRRAPQTVLVAMTTPTYVLSPVIVQAQRLAEGYSRVGFDQRKRMGVGQFLTLDDIENRHVEQFSDLFTHMRGLRISPDQPGGRDLSNARGIGSCLVYVIDGQPFNREIQGELNAMFSPSSLAGIEVYSAASVPEQFRVKSLPGVNAFGVPTMGTDGCATVVIWTKTRLGVRD